MHYKETEKQCLNYDKKVTESEGYFKGDNWREEIEAKGVTVEIILNTYLCNK